MNFDEKELLISFVKVRFAPVMNEFSSCFDELFKIRDKLRIMFELYSKGLIKMCHEGNFNPLSKAVNHLSK